MFAIHRAINISYESFLSSFDIYIYLGTHDLKPVRANCSAIIFIHEFFEKFQDISIFR